MRYPTRKDERRALELALQELRLALVRYAQAIRDLGEASSRLADSSPILCDECDHPRHEGDCTVELPDRYETGMAPMAPGPCGCKGGRQ